MNTLILMRHAKAVPPRGGNEDFQRVLAERGQMASPLAGAFLKRSGLVADRVLISAAARTRETYALVKDVAGLPVAQVEQGLYLASAATILQFIRKTPARTAAVMVIGHNPGLADLTLALADPAESDRAALLGASRKFPTATIAVFDVLAPWSEIEPGDCALKIFVTPADLGGIDED